MLVLHKSSSCDICMEEYDLEMYTKSPHAISCGHILCLTCINALPSTICPLCRSVFTVENLKKLHVNASEAETSTAPADTHTMFLLERIALVSGEDSPKEDVSTVMNEVSAWLGEQEDGDDIFSNVPLRSAFNALCRLKTQEYHGQSDLTDELETARGVEQSLLTQLEIEQEVTMTLRNDLRDAEDTIQSLHTNNERLQEELREQKAAIENLRAEFRTGLSNAVESLETSRVVEESLLAHIEENETNSASKLGAAESEIASLRSEILHLRNVVNTLRPSQSRRSSHIFHTAANSTAPFTMSDLPVRSDSSPIPLPGSGNGHLHSSLGYMTSGQPTYTTDGGISPALNIPSSPDIRSDIFSGPAAMRVQTNIPRYPVDKGGNMSERTEGLDGMHRDNYGYQKFDGVAYPRASVASHPTACTVPVYQAHKEVVADEGEENASSMECKPFRGIADRIRTLGVASLSITAAKNPPRSPDQNVSYTDNNDKIVEDASSSRSRLDNEQNGVTSLSDGDRGIVRLGWNFWAKDPLVLR